MAQRYLLLLFLTAVSLGVYAQSSTASPVGRWRTLDDQTGEVKSVVEIYAQGDKYFGRIADILTAQSDAVCDKCPGKQQGSPIKGLVIIKNLAQDGAGWNGGSILDPEKGAEYRLSAWFEANPDVLYIRGKHWTGLYRTQKWSRAH